MARRRNPRDIEADDVVQAGWRIGPQMVRTPCLRSPALSALTGATVYLKLENMQTTGSFKERGALNRLLSLSAAECRHGVIAVSAGNHARAVAYHAKRLHIHATIVMPSTTPFAKVSNTEALGATVILFGTTLSQAARHARQLATEHNWSLIHPYDDPLVIAGQGTVALEMLSDLADLDYLLVPTGGGGLLAGMAIASKTLSPRTRVVGVQVATYPALHRWFHGHRKERRSLLAPETLAEGIAVKDPSPLTHRYIRRHVDDILLVSEDNIEDAVNLLLERQKVVAEGAGAASLAALRAHPTRFAGKRVGCVISGGNIDPRVLAETITRGLARTGRLSRLHLAVRDLPGSLAKITAIIAKMGANIVDVRHQRVFPIPRTRTELELDVATRDRRHAQRVVTALRRSGYSVQLQS
ncbi:MAG TPA: threonine ammonia-lyase [Polyangiaceae bacterium]|nr:threonine ammonia-lyase [Polyangiaceae bacterium]